METSSVSILNCDTNNTSEDDIQKLTPANGLQVTDINFNFAKTSKNLVDSAILANLPRNLDKVNQFNGDDKPSLLLSILKSQHFTTPLPNLNVSTKDQLSSDTQTFNPTSMFAYYKLNVLPMIPSLGKQSKTDLDHSQGPLKEKLLSLWNTERTKQKFDTLNSSTRGTNTNTLDSQLPLAQAMLLSDKFHDPAKFVEFMNKVTESLEPAQPLTNQICPGSFIDAQIADRKRLLLHNVKYIREIISQRDGARQTSGFFTQPAPSVREIPMRNHVPLARVYSKDIDVTMPNQQVPVVKKSRWG